MYSEVLSMSGEFEERRLLGVAAAAAAAAGAEQPTFDRHMSGDRRTGVSGL